MTTRKLFPDELNPSAVRKELVALVLDAKGRERIKEGAKRVFPPWPTNGCAVTCSVALRMAGFNVRIHWTVLRLEKELRERGWRKLDQEELPQPGDVFVTVDRGGLPGGDHVGICAWLNEDHQHFACFDNRCWDQSHGRPYRRNIGPGAFTPVSSWYRWPDR